MSIGTKENSREVLSVNLVFVKSSDHLRKCLWWITRDFTNTTLKVVIAIEDNEKSNDIIDILKACSIRCSWTIIKTKTKIPAKIIWFFFFIFYMLLTNAFSINTFQIAQARSAES